MVCISLRTNLEDWKKYALLGSMRYLSYELWGSRLYFTVITLLDQLDPKKYNWQPVSGILLGWWPFIPSNFPNLLRQKKANIEFCQIVSKFLMDRERAGLFWVDSQKYADLARRISECLRDKWVYNPYTLACANMDAWIHSRHFTEIVDVHTLIPSGYYKTTYYEVGKLAFNLLPILLSRIKALGGSQVHEVTVLLRNHPAFYLIKYDALEFERVKAAQAVKEFLKVWSNSI